MPKMIIQPEGVAIAKRFFEAIELLRSQKRIRGLQTFTRAYDINWWNINTVKNDPAGHILKSEYLAYLVRDFGISAEWLLLGTGEVFTKPSSK